MDQIIQQSQKLSQKMLLSPLMLRKLSLLSYPVLRLREEIIKEIQENPALDLVEDPQSTSLETLQQETYNSSGRLSSKGDSSAVVIEHLLESPQTLAEHLKWQLHMEHLNDLSIEIGEGIIDNLDSRGFLRDDPLYFCNIIDGSNDLLITKVQKIIQHLDPVGCAVWNESESILLQVEELSLDEETEKKVEEYCFLLYSENLAPSFEQKLVQKFQSDETLQQVLQQVNPYPGANFVYESHKVPDVILPDAIIMVVGDELRIEVNNDIIPVLGISKEINELIDNESKDAKEMAERMIENAEQFMEGIQYREQIFEKVIVYIANIQKDHFLSKTEEIIPITQKEIANNLNINISTVSRIVARKFIETPLGLFPLQKFIVQRDEQRKEQSSKIVQSIVGIVSKYKGKEHLPDRIIREELKKEGIDIARRTVAKYRKLLKHET